MKHKLLSFLLVLTLLVSGLSGAVAEYEAYDKAVTITVGKEVHTSPNFADPTHTQEDNNMTALIKDVLNIDIELAWESDTYDSKLALCVAAKDLPDIFVVKDRRLYKQLVDNGMLADLSESYEKYASDYLRSVNESYNNETLLYDDEGHLYGIGGGNTYYNSHCLLWLRQDWLAALNLKAPTTLEEIEKVLIAFRDNYNSKGLLFNGQAPFGGAGNLFSAFNICAAYGAYPNTWVEGEDGKAVWGSVMPGMRDALELLARWYKEGLIDQEFATSDWNSVTAMFAAGETGAVLGTWGLPYSITDMMKQEGATLTMVNAPVNDEGIFKMIGATPYNSILCVSADCENPDALVKLLSLEFDAYLGFNKEGFERISADIANNVSWVALFPTGSVNIVASQRLIEYADCIKERVESGVWADPEKYSASMQTNANAVADYLAGDTDNSVGWIGYYGRLIASKLFKADNIETVVPVFDGVTDSMEDLWGSLQSLELQTFMSIVVGQSDISAYDNFVDQWYKQGGDIITEEVNELIGK